MELNELYEVYKKWLWLEDTKRIDVVLAVALSRQCRGIPLWLFLVGPSGDMKSEQINALENPDHTFRLTQFTSRTLVSGNPLVQDLAPRLNEKLVLTPDMASLLELRSDEKAEIWAQLRDLYDGIAGKESGSGKSAKYTGLFITWIAGSTPHIDNQILIHQTLGTRELIYRTKENINKDELMKRLFDNEQKKELMRAELKYVTNAFLKSRIFRDIELSEKAKEELKKCALYVCYMRALAESDEKGELLRDVYPEEPTRILEQLTRLFKCLINLADNYSEERALEIVREVAKSSIFPIRVKVLDYMIKNPIEHTLSNVAQILKIGKKTAYRELNILWNMGILERRTEPIYYGKDGTIPSDREIYYFIINKNHQFIKTLLPKEEEDLMEVEIEKIEDEEEENEKDTMASSAEE